VSDYMCIYERREVSDNMSILHIIAHLTYEVSDNIYTYYRSPHMCIYERCELSDNMCIYEEMRDKR